MQSSKRVAQVALQSSTRRLAQRLGTPLVLSAPRPLPLKEPQRNFSVLEFIKVAGIVGGAGSYAYNQFKYRQGLATRSAKQTLNELNRYFDRAAQIRSETELRLPTVKQGEPFTFSKEEKVTFAIYVESLMRTVLDADRRFTAQALRDHVERYFMLFENEVFSPDFDKNMDKQKSAVIHHFCINHLVRGYEETLGQFIENNTKEWWLDGKAYEEVLKKQNELVTIVEKNKQEAFKYSHYEVFMSATAMARKSPFGDRHLPKFTPEPEEAPKRPRP